MIRRRSKRARGVMKKLQKWVQNRDLKSEPFMKERLNLEGAFPAPRLYFGEFPLSFAASMGDVDMCQLLHDFMARVSSLFWVLVLLFGSLTRDVEDVMLPAERRSLCAVPVLVLATLTNTAVCDVLFLEIPWRAVLI